MQHKPLSARTKEPASTVQSLPSLTYPRVNPAVVQPNFRKIDRIYLFRLKTPFAYLTNLQILGLSSYQFQVLLLLINETNLSILYVNFLKKLPQ